MIGGSLKGRRLQAPRIPSLRPTSDRAREAMFDALEARGLVEGARVLDLFAGSGAVGIEAWSRGASFVTFVEADARAAAAIMANLQAVGLAGNSSTRVVQEEAVSFVGRAAARAGFLWDVALADPPYSFEAWEPLLEHLAEVVPVAMLEHSRPVEVGPHFETLRTYRHGGTLLTLAEKAAKPSS